MDQSHVQQLLYNIIIIIYSYCSKWRLKANVTKSVVMVFTKEAVEGI